MDKPEKEEVPTIQAEAASGATPEGTGDLTLIQASPAEFERAKASVILTTGPYGTFRFHLNHGEELMRIEHTGEVFVRGNKVDTDLNVYEGLRTWLLLAEKINPDGSKEKLIKAG